MEQNIQVQKNGEMGHFSDPAPPPHKKRMDTAYVRGMMREQIIIEYRSTHGAHTIRYSIIICSRIIPLTYVVSIHFFVGGGVGGGSFDYVYPSAIDVN